MPVTRVGIRDPGGRRNTLMLRVSGITLVIWRRASSQRFQMNVGSRMRSWVVGVVMTLTVAVSAEAATTAAGLAGPWMAQGGTVRKAARRDRSRHDGAQFSSTRTAIL